MAGLGILTIGQSPRSDVVPGLMPYLGAGVEVREAGALDGLSREEIAALAPGDGQQHLITRLRDGSSVVIAKEKILGLLQERIHALEADGVDATLILCTGSFPPFESRHPVVAPERLLEKALEAFLPRGRLGVLVPLEAQLAGARRKWARPGVEVVAAAAEPYSGPAVLDEGGRALAETQPDLVLMDCMGFRPDHKARLRKLVSAPIMLANAMVARMVGEIV